MASHRVEDKSSCAIHGYPIEPIATAAVDNVLKDALLSSMTDYYQQLRGRRIWLACSGGRDSLVLAALCVQLYQRGELPFLPQLLHVDHNLQAHSQQWAQHVAHWAHVQQIPCHILSATVTGFDEQAARQARYQVMLSYMNQGDVLMLGHHADDQAETVLMRLIQGAGVKGLSAMQPWREQSTGARKNILWRPWLSVRRTVISALAMRLQLPFIDDPTNDSGDNVRSSMRRDIMPLLTRYNANVIDNIARSAQLLRDAQATVNAQSTQDCHATTSELLSYSPVQRVLDIHRLQRLPLYRQRQLLHYWVTQDEPLPPSKQLIDDIMHLTQRQDANHQTQLYWQARQQHYVIRRYQQHLYRLRQSWLDWLQLPIVEQMQPLSIAAFGDTKLDIRVSHHASWRLNISQHPVMSHLNDNTYMLKIAPLGRKQHIQTTLSTRPQAGKKLYQTLKIPVWLRDSLVVISLCVSDKEVPLLLLSPVERWILASDRSGTPITYDTVEHYFSHSLQINDDVTLNVGRRKSSESATLIGD